MPGDSYDEDAHPRDEHGRFTSGGGGGSAKDWAKGSGGEKAAGEAPSAKEWAGGKPGGKRAAQKEAKDATREAKLASLGAESRGHATKEGAELHFRAAEAHEAAAKAHEKAGNEKEKAYHEKKASEARNSASSALTSTAHRDAENAGYAPGEKADGKAPLTKEREWVGRQTHPDKMEFEGQFAGRGKQTVDDHFVNGKPTESRAEFHEREIVEPAFAGKKTAAELGEKPVAILTMGGPASGKGVVLSKLEKNGLDKSHFVHVDPDEVKGALPEYKAQVGKGGGKTFVGAAAQVHEESSYVAKQIRDRAIEGGHHVIIDGTGGQADKFIAMMKHLENKGYDVHVHHPHLDLEEGVKRALSRADRSGRFVPEPFIRHTYESIAKSQERIVAAAPNYTRYDGKNGHQAVEKKRRGE